MQRVESIAPMQTHTADPVNPPRSKFARSAFVTAIILMALAVLVAMIWQGVTAQGSPDPTKANTSPTVAVFDIGVLVFREGLECILVIAAITASMVGEN